MITVDLMSFKDDLRIKRQEDQRLIWDPIRKKWLVLQPEEMVRQLLLCYLMQGKGYPASRIRMEMGLKLNALDKRCDLLVYDQDIKPWLLAECKAPHVHVSLDVFEQIARYNLVLQVPYLLVTNGLETHCCLIDYQTRTYNFLEDLPSCPS